MITPRQVFAQKLRMYNFWMKDTSGLIDKKATKCVAANINNFAYETNIITSVMHYQLQRWIKTW